MTVVYRDELGRVAVEITPDGVSFNENYAFFDDVDGNTYKIAVSALESIA